jgi:hypothetical protein
MTTPPEPPRCPACDEDGSRTEVVLVEHGYHMAPVAWDDEIGDWSVEPEAWNLGWNGDESYWQCNECFWQGGDPIGLEPEGDDADE